MFEVDKESLKAVNKTFRSLPSDLRNNIKKYQRAESNPIWRSEVNARTGYSKFTQSVFRSGTTVQTGAVITLMAGTSKRKLSGGGTPYELAYPADLGSMRRDKYTKYYRTSPNGTRHIVNRRTGRGLKTFKKAGYVVRPAARPTISRLVSLHVQTITKSIYEATESR